MDSFLFYDEDTKVSEIQSDTIRCILSSKLEFQLNTDEYSCLQLTSLSSIFRQNTIESIEKCKSRTSSHLYHHQINAFILPSLHLQICILYPHLEHDYQNGTPCVVCSMTSMVNSRPGNAVIYSKGILLHRTFIAKSRLESFLSLLTLKYRL